MLSSSGLTRQKHALLSPMWLNPPCSYTCFLEPQFSDFCLHQNHLSQPQSQTPSFLNCAGKHNSTLPWEIKPQKQMEETYTLVRISCTATFRLSQPLWGAGIAYEQLGEDCDTTRMHCILTVCQQHQVEPEKRYFTQTDCILKPVQCSFLLPYYLKMQTNLKIKTRDTEVHPHLI